MAARAYTTILSESTDWTGPRMEVTSVPHGFTDSYTAGDLVGSLRLEPSVSERFENVSEVRGLLLEHFSEHGLADLVGLVFDDEFVVIEESPGKARALSAVGGAGAVAAGFAVFGPWAIIAVPVGVFLLAAAPAAGEGFGDWVRDWFRRHSEDR